MEIFWCSTKFLGLAQNVHLLSVWPKTFGPAHNILGPVEGPDINKWFILPFTQKICLLGDDVSKFPYDGLKKSCSDKIEMSFFKPTFPPKNGRTNSILLLWDLFLFGFWRKLKTPNRHFEIKWPFVVVATDQTKRFVAIYSCLILPCICGQDNWYVWPRNYFMILCKRWAHENAFWAVNCTFGWYIYSMQ